jgi:hypothetical protein
MIVLATKSILRLRGFDENSQKGGKWTFGGAYTQAYTVECFQSHELNRHSRRAFNNDAAKVNKEAVNNALKDFMAIAEDGDSANNNLDNCLSLCSDKWGTGSSANNCQANCRANESRNGMDHNSSRKKKYSRSDRHCGHDDDAADVQ